MGVYATYHNRLYTATVIEKARCLGEEGAAFVELRAQ